MFSCFKKIKRDKRVTEVPGWTRPPYHSIAQELSNAGLAENWEDKIADAEPQSVLETLRVVPGKAGKGCVLGRRLWIMATAYRKVHQELQKCRVENAKLEEEKICQEGQIVTLQCGQKLLSDRLSHYQGIAEKIAVQIAEGKYKKRRGKVNEMKVRAVVAETSAENWNPNKWDEDVWDSSSDDDCSEPNCSEPKIDPPNRPQEKPPTSHSALHYFGRVTRRDIFQALLKAGVSKFQINGAKTKELWKLYKQKVQRKVNANTKKWKKFQKLCLVGELAAMVIPHAERAKRGEGGLADLHEKETSVPAGDLVINPMIPLAESPVEGSYGLGIPYGELSPEQQLHTWSTDGSAKYVSGKRKQKTVTGKTLELDERFSSMLVRAV